MNYPEFAKRFRDHQEIGRDLTDASLLVFYDNGNNVGLWREDRRTTQGTGEVLCPDDAEMARYWYRNGVRTWAEREHLQRSVNVESSAILREPRR